ncbi:MAG: class I SAM-dependent methyltransferase [Planctomycetota bacterium]|nr:MAG: class I SAM-dependent methyltransferase [Planctomycetota bacterium]
MSISGPLPQLTPPQAPPLYDYPLWYERAFSWRRPRWEAARLLDFARPHAQRPLQQVIELYAGPAVHGPHLQALGLQYVGVDCNPQMLARARGRGMTMVEGDALAPRRLGHCDLLLCLLGSLVVANGRELQRHLRQTARMVRPGGIYLLEWCVQGGEPAILHDHWKRRRADYWLEVDFCSIPDVHGEHYTERLLLQGEDAEGPIRLCQRQRGWMVTPAALRRLCGAASPWECLGSWDRWDPDRPLSDEQAGQRPMTVLRRRREDPC